MVLERDIEMIKKLIVHFNGLNCIVLKPINSPRNKYIEFQKCNTNSTDKLQIKKFCFDEYFTEIKNIQNKDLRKNEKLEELKLDDQKKMKNIIIALTEKITINIGLCTKGFQKYLPSCNKDENKIGSLVKDICVLSDKDSFWKDFPNSSTLPN
jgi:hypothetical protein